jgi:hypothetical protein
MKENLQPPSFIGIGAQRAGTSWLYNCLRDHPEIYMPQKEVHFFDIHYEKGIEWYFDLFSPLNKGIRSGEITPDYMFDEQAILRLKKHAPDTKLVVILRSPLDRAYSAYNLFRSHGRYSEIDFNQAVTKDPFILEQSLYSPQIERIFNLFPRENIHICFYEDIASSPNLFFKNVCSFLNIDGNFVPDTLTVRKNSSAFSSQQRVFNIPKIQKNIEGSILGRPFKKLKKTKAFSILKEKIISFDNKQKTIPTLSKDKLLLIENDIARLETILNISLNRWRQL